MSKRTPKHAWAALAAAIVFAAAVAGFGAAFVGYSQREYPVALLGAQGVAHALAFNLLGFVLPGVLVAMVAAGLRRGVPAAAGFAARIGGWLLMLSALAFAALGLLPLDPEDLDARASHLHVGAWTLWWIAFVPGALLFALGALRVQAWRPLAIGGVLAAALVLVFAGLAADAGGAGVAQRIAYAVWFGWWLLAGRTLDRSAVKRHISRSAA